jgi:hypothetical protein
LIRNIWPPHDEPSVDGLVRDSQITCIGMEVYVNASPLRFGLGAVLVILPLGLFAQAGASLGLWQAISVILIVGGPVWLTLAYLSAIRKAHATAILRRPVWWGVVLSGHGMRMFLALVPAFLAGLGMVGAILTQGVWAMVWPILAAGLVFSGARLVRARATQDLRPFAQGLIAIRFAVAVTAVALTLISMIWSVRPAAPDSVAALFDATVAYRGPSAAVALIADWTAFLSGAQAMAEKAATGQGLPVWLVTLWHGMALFGYHLGLALCFAACWLMSAEARRILAPTDSDTPARVPALTLALASGVAAILAVILFQTFARIELTAQLVAATETTAPRMTGPSADPDPLAANTTTDRLPVRDAPSPLSPAGLMRQIEAEVIGDLQCPPGTIAAIEAMDSDFRNLLDRQQDDLRAAIGTGFDAVRANVPVFLDWYYTLSAEYLRTVNLVIGNGVEYLDQQFTARLEQGAPLAGIDTALSALSANQLLAGIYRDSRAAQLASCALALPQDGAVITATDSRSPDFLTTDLHLEAISLETRLAAAGMGGAAGLVAGGIMAKIGAKAIASGVFKTAAAALVKMAGGKAISLGGGILLGAGSGAAAGSVVPGAGTTAGAIAGGIAGGIAVMLGVDFALLKLDEELSRTDFETEIMAAIDSAESELLAQLGLSLP